MQKERQLAIARTGEPADFSVSFSINLNYRDFSPSTDMVLSNKIFCCVS